MMVLPRAIVNRLLSTAQTAAGAPASGVITRDGCGVWRVEAETTPGRKVITRWVVNMRSPAGGNHLGPLLRVDTDTKGVLQLVATDDGAEVMLEIED